MGDFVPQFLLSVSQSGGNETVTIATAENGVQDKSNNTQQTTLSKSSFPDSEFVIAEFPIKFERTDQNTGETANVCATIRNMTFTNILPGEDDTARTDGKFKATGYMGALAPLFFIQKDPTADSICTMLASEQYETPCETCSFNDKQQCLTIGAIQIGAKPTAASVEQLSLNDTAASCL